MEDLERAAAGRIGWFIILAPGKIGRIHVHALVLNVLHLNRTFWTRAWFTRGGTARIKVYDPSKGAVFYCSKHLDHALEYDFSEHLEVFQGRVQC
jgi:hypothetical protein